MTGNSPKPRNAGTEVTGAAYSAEFHPAAAEKLYALGATQNDAAAAFRVPLETIAAWEHDHTEFRDACARGRSTTANQLEHALYKRAVGYVQYNKKPVKVCGELVIARHHRPLAPNVAAMRLFLNKQNTFRNDSHNHLKCSKTQTAFDIIAENSMKQKDKERGDD
jgi:hypothetical protein